MAKYSRYVKIHLVSTIGLCYSLNVVTTILVTNIIAIAKDFSVFSGSGNKPSRCPSFSHNLDSETSLRLHCNQNLCTELPGFGKFVDPKFSRKILSGVSKYRIRSELFASRFFIIELNHHAFDYRNWVTYRSHQKKLLSSPRVYSYSWGSSPTTSVDSAFVRSRLTTSLLQADTEVVPDISKIRSALWPGKEIFILYSNQIIDS
jgi:hypothetical protein